jgi:AcrR family transcriptional regulator
MARAAKLPSPLDEPKVTGTRPAPDAGGAVADGRRARRDRNRDAVVDALLELFAAGNLAPSADEIAERAGVSPRSVFRYFDDVDDLCRAAITRQQARVQPLLVIGAVADAPLDVRIAALVEQRLRLFDAIRSVGQVSRIRAPFQPLIAAELRQARAFLRRQVEQVLGPELAELGAARGATVLAAADVLCSFESYHLLREDQRLSRSKAAAVLVDAIGALLATTSEEDR